MIPVEFLALTHLARPQAFCIYETPKVIVVSENKDLVFPAFQVLASCFKDLHNGQKLTIVSFVSCFSKNHFMQEVSQQMPLARVINQLTQHSTNSISRRISFNLDVLFWMKVLKDKRFGKGFT